MSVIPPIPSNVVRDFTLSWTSFAPSRCSSHESGSRARDAEEYVDDVGAALDAYERRLGDLADYLIREEARAEGCDAVVTFDRALLEDEGFRTP